MSRSTIHDAELADALRALGVYTLSTRADGALGQRERAYLLGSLLFAAEQHAGGVLMDDIDDHGNEGDVIVHMVRGFLDMAARMGGDRDSGTSGDPLMSDRTGYGLWLLLNSRAGLTAALVDATEETGGAALPDAEAAVSAAAIASQVMTTAAALRYAPTLVHGPDAARQLRHLAQELMHLAMWAIDTADVRDQETGAAA